MANPYFSDTFFPSLNGKPYREITSTMKVIQK